MLIRIMGIGAPPPTSHVGKMRMNGELRGIPRVRVIGVSGEDLGEMQLSEALRLAMKEGLDLVEVKPSAVPPVCKLLDFEKYKYEERRKAARSIHDRDEEPDGPRSPDSGGRE